MPTKKTSAAAAAAKAPEYKLVARDLTPEELASELALRTTLLAEATALRSAIAASVSDKDLEIAQTNTNKFWYKTGPLITGGSSGMFVSDTARHLEEARELQQKKDAAKEAGTYDEDDYAYESDYQADALQSLQAYIDSLKAHIADPPKKVMVRVKAE